MVDTVPPPTDTRADAPLHPRDPRPLTVATVSALTLLAPPSLAMVDVPIIPVPPREDVPVIPVPKRDTASTALPNPPALQDSEVDTVVDPAHPLEVDSPATVRDHPAADLVVLQSDPRMLISVPLMPANLESLVMTRELRFLIRTHTTSRKRPARTVLLSSRIPMATKPLISTRIRHTILMRPLTSRTRTDTTSELLVEKTWTESMTATPLRIKVLLLVSTRIEDTTLMLPSTRVPLVAFTSPSSVIPLPAMDSTPLEAIPTTVAEVPVAQDTDIKISIPATVLDPVRSRFLPTLRSVARSSSRTSLSTRMILKSAVRPKFRSPLRTTLTSSSLVISKLLVSQRPRVSLTLRDFRSKAVLVLKSTSTLRLRDKRSSFSKILRSVMISKETSRLVVTSKAT